ncbi:MAG TPA: methyl-accepting chemotaxis protein [Planctomycetota bacterium]|nr:methyl-accepting chemotaxis protein [Planctomycetota bacterium]
MTRNWTFGQKISGGFAMSVLLTVAVASIAIISLREVVATKDRVIEVNAQNLVDAERLRAASATKGAAARGYLLAKHETFLTQLRDARSEIVDLLAQLNRHADTEEVRKLVAKVEAVESQHNKAMDEVIAGRQSEEASDTWNRMYEDRVQPLRAELDKNVLAFVTLQSKLLEDGVRSSSEFASKATTLTVGVTSAALLLAVIIAAILAKTLGRQIGESVGRVQSSSAELQAAANQQATGAKEQATAMSEISTTINELLATSKQIAESAQRVAHIADSTARASKAGEGTVEKAHESIATTRKQVDLVVSHMLELGTKSQHIGAVLDIVSELAEQTNILAINATIEAAGAGDAGKRFAMVADEIRKLADRVGASTKEIRNLIDDVRGSVNTTVMATEGGSKAVEAGSRQFTDVAAAFKQIAALVATTTEAAREIELSTKQQASAVEQVNVAISNVAQTTRETEASSGETLQTASQLTSLSRELLRLIRPQATGPAAVHA